MTALAIVCPQCHAALQAEGVARRCTGCAATFPARATVPVLIGESEWAGVRHHLDEEASAREAYGRARRTTPLTLQYFDWWVARLYAAVPAELNGELVELMCGGAEVCRRLPPRFTTAVALDLDVDMVADAARDLAAVGEQRVQLVCGDAARLPLPDACTSVVIVQGALHHARPVLPDILREIHRILRPGGVLVGSEPANDHPLTRRIREWQYRRSTFQGNDPDEEGFDRHQLGALLAASGLSLQRYEQFGFIAYPLMGNTDLLTVLRGVSSRRLGRALLALDQVLERVPGIRGMAWASLFRAVKR